MTSRPSLGISRPPQRSLSGSGLTQRSQHQRSLSHQYPSSSPTRRNENNILDLIAAAADPANNGRHGAPRITGSRLRLETSQDAQDDPILLDSPQLVDAAPLPDLSTLPSQRGKPRLEFDANALQRGSLHSASRPTSAREFEKSSSQMALPMPRRPGQNMVLRPRRPKTEQSATVKKDSRPKPYVLELPAAAPLYPLDGHADFFPWTGDHPEDQFTDSVIRHGFFDKTQTTQNETGSAKLSIFPALKHKAGLQTLSSLLTSVLAQRRAHSLITTPSTFKPPPRVTLTDTKRETWLKDLANPTISLRRLSRTIPHGIKGKILLEQCLSKKIPTERAVWLAKCVGANEIRAFKRKGVTGQFAMGGEAKWIRDWTAFVEQFTEGVSTNLGEDGIPWKENILYAIQLSSHLYDEGLLDRDHYLEWLTTSLENCPSAKLPLWVLITQVFWNQLLSYRKYGRRIVAALCAHLQEANDSLDRDLLIPLIERLVLLLQGLMDRHPESFISPKALAKYGDTLESCLISGDNSTPLAYDAIKSRILRLSFPTTDNIPTPRQRLIHLLDDSLLQPFSNNVSKTCWQAMQDPSGRIQTLLQWSTSATRPGLTKTFVAARVLRSWSRFDIDLNDEILTFLGSAERDSGISKAALYHLISELARSGHFSTSRYIQWLIARGGVRGCHDTSPDGPCTTRLLAELPLDEIPENLDKLRRTILSRASFSVDDEVETIDTMLATISRHLPVVIPSCNMDTDDQEISGFDVQNLNLSTLSRTVKSQIGLWLREHVNKHVVQPAISAEDWKDQTPSKARSALRSGELNIIRSILEAGGDMSILADVLKTASSSDDIQVLASACDTLNLHLETFAAIGASKDIFDSLLARYRSLSPEQEGEALTLTVALCDLAGRMPGAEVIASHLSLELARNSRKTAAEACSPVSDYKAEVLQGSDSGSSDEIEKILASGNSMDASTMERLFQILVGREVGYTEKSPNRRVGVLLARLRSFDPKRFDELMLSWVQRLLLSQEHLHFSHIFGPLIAAGCLEFKTVLTCTATFVDGVDDRHTALRSNIAAEALKLLLGTKDRPNFMTVEESYRLDIKRCLTQRALPVVALAVLRQAITLAEPPPPEENRLLTDEALRMQSLLQRITLADLEATSQYLVTPLATHSDSAIGDRLRRVVNSLLASQAEESELSQKQNTAQRIEAALQLANDLTLPFCQLELRAIFAAEIPQWSNQESASGQACLEAFERAIDFAVTANSTTWTNIIPGLDVRIGAHLCQRAESQFLDLIPSKTGDVDDAIVKGNIESAKRLLFVVRHTSYSMQPARTLTIGTQIVEKINAIWQNLAQGGNDIKLASAKFLPLLLSFISLHNTSLEFSTKAGADTRARILLSLAALLVSSNNSSLELQILDTCLLLVDDLPEDSRLGCVRTLKDKTTDRRLQYIFSFSSSQMDWLQLRQKRNGPANGGLVPYPLRRWETLSEPTPVVGENDTSLSLTLFGARKA